MKTVALIIVILMSFFYGGVGGGVIERAVFSLKSLGSPIGFEILGMVLGITIGVWIWNTIDWETNTKSPEGDNTVKVFIWGMIIFGLVFLLVWGSIVLTKPLWD